MQWGICLCNLQFPIALQGAVLELFPVLSLSPGLQGDGVDSQASSLLWTDPIVFCVKILHGLSV